MAKKRPVLLIAALGALLAVVRRRKAGRTGDASADLWREATGAPEAR